VPHWRVSWVFSLPDADRDKVLPRLDQVAELARKIRG
jgi:hypothetical protein